MPKKPLSQMSEPNQIKFIKRCQRMIAKEFKRYFKNGRLTGRDAQDILNDVLDINWNNKKDSLTQIEYYVYERFKEDLEN